MNEGKNGDGALQTANAIGVSSTSLLGLGFIEKIEDKSDHILPMVRMLIYFKNGRKLSVIRGPYSFGGSKGLYEIMPAGKAGDDGLFDECDQGDSVCGYLSGERVEYYIKKIGLMP